MTTTNTKSITHESKLNIGITFFASQQINNIWSNGTVQNVLFLYQLFENSPRVGEVYLINGGDSDSIPENLLPAGMKPRMARLDAIVNKLDVVIDFHVQVNTDQEKMIRDAGAKLIQFKSGNVYVMEIENSIFNLPRPNSLLCGVQYDETWTLPHHAKTCKSFLETIYRAPVEVMPYLWDPTFINYALEQTGIGKKFFYQPGRMGGTKKRVAILEPNFNIVKTCHYPILICEEAYRKNPEAFSNIYVNNIEHMRSQKNFVHFTHYLDITQKGIASYEGRYDTPFFLSNHADIVVTHNWENQLNNLYFDVLYGNYPLVHDSEMLRGVGYYYEPFNAQDGARALLKAVETHDTNIEQQAERNSALFEQLSTSNVANIERHVNRLFALFGTY